MSRLFLTASASWLLALAILSINAACFSIRRTRLRPVGGATIWVQQASPGNLHLPAWLGIVLASVLFAPVGAWLAHRLPAHLLRRFFAIFLLVLGFYMFTPH